MSKEKKHRKADWKRLKGTTNFYPTYVDGNLDKVTPAAATYSNKPEKNRIKSKKVYKKKLSGPCVVGEKSY